MALWVENLRPNKEARLRYDSKEEQDAASNLLPPATLHYVRSHSHSISPACLSVLLILSFFEG